MGKKIITSLSKKKEKGRKKGKKGKEKGEKEGNRKKMVFGLHKKISKTFLGKKILFFPQGENELDM